MTHTINRETRGGVQLLVNTKGEWGESAWWWERDGGTCGCIKGHVGGGIPRYGDGGVDAFTGRSYIDNIAVMVDLFAL